MQLTLTISDGLVEEILEALQKASLTFGASGANPPSIPPKTDAPKKEAAPKTADVKKEEKPAPKAAEPKKEAAKPASGLTLESVAGKIAELCQNKTLGGKDKARELLAKYGAKKGGELKPEQYAAFIADVDATLNPSTGEPEEDGLM